ncbi:SpoIIE family protein phosphatase [Actinoplanes sp. NPDC049548]|uniref:nSTAND1 domain-containing NTPase n=1 Tax=Actinoplanes sp. NPDC049548 TaxID=3155152 RepID=UPI00342BCC58
MRTTPVATLAAMAAAAVAPVVMAGADGGLVTALAGMGGGVGGNYLTSWLYATVQRMGGGRDLTEAVLRDVIADELSAAVQREDDRSLALRADVAQMLEGLDAVHIVLEDAADDCRQALVTVLSRVDQLPGQLQTVAAQLEGSLQRLRAEWTQESRQTRRILHRLVEQSDAQLALLRDATAPPPVQYVTCRAPYPGLAGFHDGDSGLFFGRDDLIATLRTRLLVSCTCVVTGESGSGKSSLLRAGLSKGLATSPYDAQRRWQLLYWAAGDTPVEDLADRLADALALPHRRVAEAIGTGRLASLLADRPFDQRLVIVADQFERLFTRCTAEDRARIVAALLWRRAPDHPMVVIVSVRADFLAYCVADPLLAGALEDQQLVVGPMRTPDVRAAVELPARAVGGDIERALVDQIITDAVRWPRSLPLMAHALREVWKRRSDGTMRFDDYRAIGGMAGAISSTADAVLEALRDDERVLARRLITGCVDIDPDRATHTSRPIPLGHLTSLGSPEDVHAVMEQLRSAAVISLTAHHVELTHEALITAWPTLARWVTEDEASIKARSRLRRAAREWDGRGRHAELLYGPIGMAEVETLLREGSSQLAPVEEAFAEESRAALARAAGQREAAEAQNRVARTVQRALLPATLPTIHGVSLAVTYAPGSMHSEVGGDWYELIATSPDELLLVVGDVAGSGLAAIPLMAQLRIATRAYAVDNPPPDELLHHLNRYLTRFPEDRDATAFAASLSVGSGRLRWSSAAHLDAFVWNPAEPDRTVALAGAKGPALGGDVTGRYPLHVHDLTAGTRLLIFTGDQALDLGEPHCPTSVGVLDRFTAGSSSGTDLMATVESVMHTFSYEEDRCVVALELER